MEASSASDSGGGTRADTFLVRETMQSSSIESMEKVQAIYERLRESVRKALVGKDGVVDLCLISLLAGGHVLLTDIPGVGKTTLAKVVERSRYRDRQTRPDPSDSRRAVRVHAGGEE